MLGYETEPHFVNKASSITMPDYHKMQKISTRNFSKSILFLSKPLQSPTETSVNFIIFLRAVDFVYL